MAWLMKCVSREQTEVVRDHIHNGATLQGEAVRLGVSPSCLWYALRELLGEDAYKALLKQSRARRVKLPPSTVVPPLPTP